MTTRTLAAAIALALAATACGGGTTGTTTPIGTDPPTTAVPDPTTTTSAPGASDIDLCSASHEAVALELDGAPPIEWVVVAAAPGGASRIAICDGPDMLAAGGFEGVAGSVLGVVDVDDVAPFEILIEVETDRGPGVRLARSTLRGIEVTDVVGEHWIDAGEPDDEFFEGASFECRDIDDDGALEFVTVAYRPADTPGFGDGDPVINVRVELLAEDDGALIVAGLDAFELPAVDAHARWSDDHRCGPDVKPRAEVRWGPGGWGVLDATGSFASPGNLLMTAAAHDPASGRYVAVGTESPSFLLGEVFEMRPAIWWSDDRVTWNRAELGGASGELRDVIAIADGGFVAVGAGPLGPAAWTSADGIAWESASPPIGAEGLGGQLGHAMAAVVEGPYGLIAVGTETYAPTSPAPGEDLDPAIWTSIDGREWTRVQDPALGSAGFQPNLDGEFNGDLVGIAFAPGIGYVAAGSASSSDSSIDYPEQVPTVWVSADGVSWDRRTLGLDGRLRGIVSAASGLGVFGVTDLHGSPFSDAMVASSSDGLTWQAVDGPFGGTGATEGIQTMNAAESVPGMGVFLVGSDEAEWGARGAAAVWMALDSLDVWERVASDHSILGDPDAAPTLTMTGAAWDGAALLVVGFTGRSIESPGGVGTACCVYEPAVWIWDPGLAGE